MRKFIFGTLLVIILGVVGWGYYRYYYVFGEGVKTGQLNYIVYKGYVFKTYEGKLIQSGFRGTSTTTPVGNSKSASSTVTTSGFQSYEFEFSVEDKAIADSLMRCGGREVELHYKEYLNTLPWRGVSKYVVDGILEVR